LYGLVSILEAWHSAVFDSLAHIIAVSQGRRKIVKAGDAAPTAFEETCAQELYNIEMQHTGLKADLYPLHITAAREITTDGKKAVVLFVPYTQLSNYHKIQKTLVEELEKKFA
jgi:hypothetical protein